VPDVERIETERLVGVRPGPEHAEFMTGLLGDSRVGATLGGVRSPAEASLILDQHVALWERDGYGYWMWQDRETGEWVARGGLRPLHVGGSDEVEVGWAVVPRRWRQGLGTELALASIGVAFGPLDLASVVAFTLPHNVASRRVMEKTGFSYEKDIVWAELPHVLYRRRREDSTV
jgi:[ribosomal protein S5]-alanine N-acetyltransferase